MIKELGRINELAAIAKERELTQEELSEREDLRKKYLAAVRGGFDSILLNSTVRDPEGKDITPEKLRDAQKKLKEERSE